MRGPKVEGGCPVDAGEHLEFKDIDVNTKERIHLLSWEPRGTRFALVHGGETATPTVSFYQVRSW
jgi:uncharacterized protein with WD repeat